MNEKEAWLTIAEYWKHAKNGVVFLGCSNRYGICSCISWLYQLGRIQAEIKDSMKDKLDIERRVLGRIDEMYIWTDDDNGSLARWDFCRRMADAEA